MGKSSHHAPRDEPSREQAEALLSSPGSGDPRFLLRMMGVNLPDDAEFAPELLDQWTNDSKL